MSKPRKPIDPDSLTLKPGTDPASGERPDFGNVRSSVRSTEQAAPKADFSRVTSSVNSTEDVLGTTRYTVQKGDTLSHIAKAHYGKASHWQRIFEANRDQLDDPDRIQPGQVLTIPSATREDDGSTTPPHGDKP